MKKELGKKVNQSEKETVESYCNCSLCSCNCYGNLPTATDFSDQVSRDQVDEQGY